MLHIHKYKNSEIEPTVYFDALGTNEMSSKQDWFMLGALATKAVIRVC